MYCELVSLNMPYLETECTLGVLLTRQLDLLGLGEDVMWWKGFQAAHGIFDGFVKLAAQTNQVVGDGLQGRWAGHREQQGSIQAGLATKAQCTTVPKINHTQTARLENIRHVS